MTSVDAIVVSYNTRDMLHACLASLGGSRVEPRKTFVVDNASTDGSPDMIRSVFPDVELIEAGDNLGFARANNMAFEHSDADAILLLNADAELRTDSLGALIEVLGTEADVGAVGPILSEPSGRIQFEGGRRDPSILGEFSNITGLGERSPHGPFGRYMMREWDHRSSRDVDVLSGACLLIRTAALRGKLFDEDYFMYGEDVEVCQRLRSGGWRLRYCAEAEVLHHGAASSRQIRTRMRVAGVRSMARLFSRRRGPVYAAAYVAMVPGAVLLGRLLRLVWRGTDR